MELTKENIIELLQNIKIARVEKIEKHPDADRLLITRINDGEGEPKQVVTGANNFKEGDLVPYLGVGFMVPGFLIFENQEITLQKKPLRGVDSYGMILADDEIGIGHDHSGIRILTHSPQLTAQSLIGKPITDVLSDDEMNTIFSNAGIVEITPDIQRRIDLIMSVGNSDNGGEIIGASELPKILSSNEPLYTYDGFEPSGQMHIAQGIIRAINTNKMIEAGFTFRMLIADWFGYLNNKMGGDLEKIKKVGEYFIELWRASGMDLEHTEFLWTSDFVGQREYWETVMKVSKAATLKRVLRTTEIMGRSESDDLSTAQILYPAMQVTDIFYVMKCQVTQLGLDQRKVNMLAREIGPEIGFWKPVVVSHGMLQGLGKPVKEYEELYLLIEQSNPIFYPVNAGKSKIIVTKKDDKLEIIILDYDAGKTTMELREGAESSIKRHKIKVEKNDQGVFKLKFFIKVPPEDRSISMKMSKSKPDTAIFMTDTKKEIERKIMKAYCPPNQKEDNPILDYCKQIIFEAKYLKRQTPILGEEGFEIKRDEKYGGNVSYKTYKELESDYISGRLDPADLKPAVINYIDMLLQPVRDHFENNERAKKLLEEVRSFQITR